MTGIINKDISIGDVEINNLRRGMCGRNILSI